MQNVSWKKISQNSDLRQDAIKPNLLIKQYKPLQPLSTLEVKREEVQEKCIKLKIDSLFFFLYFLK